MSNSFLSPFQLLGTSFELISFEVETSTTDNGIASLSLGHYFDDDNWRKDGLWAIKGGISVECKWVDSDDATMCKGSCIIRGGVSVVEAAYGDDFPEDELELLLQANLISLLYGEARSVIEFISSNTASGKRILPSIDPFEYLSPEQEAEE